VKIEAARSSETFLYPTTKLRDVTTQTTLIRIFSTVKTSQLARANDFKASCLMALSKMLFFKTIAAVGSCIIAEKEVVR
jgi:hypothetical protein